MTAPQQIAPGQLSVLQVRIVRLAANGWSDQQIAQVTRRAYDTIRSHWKIIFVALNAISRPHAVALAMAARIITAADIETPRPRMGRVA